MREILLTNDPGLYAVHSVYFFIFTLSYRPFYGYHAKEKHFMKIYLYNPQIVKR